MTLLRRVGKTKKNKNGRNVLACNISVFALAIGLSGVLANGAISPASADDPLPLMTEQSQAPVDNQDSFLILQTNLHIKNCKMER